MKRILVVLLIAGFGITAFSQEDQKTEKKSQEFQTIFGSDDITHGGYGAVSINYSQIDGADALLVGGRGAWLINHSVGIGIGGYGLPMI